MLRRGVRLSCALDPDVLEALEDKRLYEHDRSTLQREAKTRGRLLDHIGYTFLHDRHRLRRHLEPIDVTSEHREDERLVHNVVQAARAYKARVRAEVLDGLGVKRTASPGGGETLHW